MGIFTEIKDIMTNRLVQKLSLRDESAEEIYFSNSKYYLFIRLVLSVVSVGLFTVISFLLIRHNGGNPVPVWVFTVLGFFLLAFLSVMVYISTISQTLLINKKENKIFVFNKNAVQHIINFNQVEGIELATRIDIERNRPGPSRRYTKTEVLLLLKNGTEIQFSEFSEYTAALELANKLAEFTGARFKNEAA